MLDPAEALNWSELARSYGEAERALGKLAHALEATRLHPTWLWREITRTAVIIVQTSGYQVDIDQLRMALIGAPVDTGDNTPGLAAAKRVFLTATPLFRSSASTDTNSTFWPAFWNESSLCTDGHDADGEAEENRPRKRLAGLVKELAVLADDARRPALINLFTIIRRQAGTKRLPPQLLRLVLPLALVETGLVPKAAPGLLGGRRLPLGMSVASSEARPLADWLEAGLDDLAREARQSHRRLAELTSRLQAWHNALAGAGLRRHARAPQAIDLLTATPVLSIGLIAAHLGCSHVAAGKVAEKLLELGILMTATSRSRHKIFVAGDLSVAGWAEEKQDQPLSFSNPIPAIDVDALDATLDGLFAHLERLHERIQGHAGL